MGDCGGDIGGGGGGSFGVGYGSPRQTRLSQHPCAVISFFTAFILLIPLGLFIFLGVSGDFRGLPGIAGGVCSCLVVLMFGLGCYCCRRRPRNGRPRPPAAQTTTVRHQEHMYLPSLTTATNGSANTPSGSNWQTQTPTWTHSSPPTAPTPTNGSATIPTAPTPHRPVTTTPDLDPPPSYSEAMKMDTVQV